MSLFSKKQDTKKTTRKNSPAFFSKRPDLVNTVDMSTELTYSAAVTGVDVLMAQPVVDIASFEHYGLVAASAVKGVASIAIGVAYLADENTYSQISTKSKGALNLLSGVQLLLSNLTGFFLPALALSMGCDMVCAIIDFCKAYKELSYEGWLAERKDEEEFLENKIKPLAVKEKNGSISASEKIKLISFAQQLEKVSADIKAREIINNANANAKQPINGGIYKRTDTDIQKAMQVQFDKARLNLIIKTASFIGVSILAVASLVSCPPLTIVGMIVCSLAAAGYLYKHSEGIAKTAQRFFTLNYSNDEPKKPVRNMRHEFYNRHENSPEFEHQFKHISLPKQ